MPVLHKGDFVQLRDGSVRGPLRDRSRENDAWPWGLKCPTCGTALHTSEEDSDDNEGGGIVWRPDGRAGSYFKEDNDHPKDIVAIIDERK